MDNQPNIQITNGGQNTDHDLLLTIKAEMGTKLDRVIADVKDLNDNFAGRVADLEQEKLSKDEFQTYCATDAKEFQDYKVQTNSDFTDYKTDMQKGLDDREARLRFLERYAWLAIGALTIIQFVIGYILIRYFGNTPL